MGQLTQADPMDSPYCITSCLAIKTKCKGGRKRQTDIPLSSLINFYLVPRAFSLLVFLFSPQFHWVKWEVSKWPCGSELPTAARGETQEKTKLEFVWPTDFK